MYLNTLQTVQFHQHDTIEVKTKNSTKKMTMLNQQFNDEKDDERFGGEDGKRLKGGKSRRKKMNNLVFLSCSVTHSSSSYPTNEPHNARSIDA